MSSVLLWKRVFIWAEKSVFYPQKRGFISAEKSSVSPQKRGSFSNWRTRMGTTFSAEREPGIIGSILKEYEIIILICALENIILWAIRPSSTKFERKPSKYKLTWKTSYHCMHPISWFVFYFIFRWGTLTDDYKSNSPKASREFIIWVGYFLSLCTLGLWGIAIISVCPSVHLINV